MLLLFFQRHFILSILKYLIIPTNTLVLLIEAIKNWQQLLIRSKLNDVPRYLVNKYFHMKAMKYFHNYENFVWIYFVVFVNMIILSWIYFFCWAPYILYMFAGLWTSADLYRNVLFKISKSECHTLILFSSCHIYLVKHIVWKLKKVKLACRIKTRHLLLK